MREIKKLFSILSLCFLLVCGFIVIKSNIGELSLSEAKAKKQFDERLDIDYKDLYSQNIIVMDHETGQIIYEKNKDDRIYPASMTKIMTVLLGVENLDFEEESFVEHETISKMFKEGASMAGFKGGKSVNNMDLLYGSILPSGGEASITIANEIAGTEDEFSSLMNTKSKEIGMLSSNFKNATGLHDEKHYTTVADMARLLDYSLKNHDFKDIFTKMTYRASNGLEMESTLLKKDDLKTKNGEILGGKTGYTKEAGLTLASLVRVDDKEYVIVVAKNAGNNFTEAYNIKDVKKIMEYL